MFRKINFNFVLFLLITACTVTPKKVMITKDSNQLITNTKENSVSELAEAIVEQVQSKGFKVVANIDHAAAASKVGLTLRPTQTIIFGNPLGGTKLMQQNQSIGLDLPLKILVWEDETGKANLSYYNGTALTQRYQIEEPQAVISKVNGALAKFTGSPESIEITAVDSANDLVIKKSLHSTDSTFTKLKETITSKGLTIMAEVAHDKAAASVDLELRPTRLLIFGNPKIGTMLMQSDQKIGIDLPLKILVHETAEGEVLVSYFNASTLSERYNIVDKEAVITKVNGALNAITDAAIN